MNIPVSIYSDYFGEFPIERAIEEFCAAGFQYGELSLEHLEMLMNKPNPEATGKALKAVADQNGYRIPQGHLSFSEGLIGEQAVERLKPELDMFAEAGIRKAVIHVNGGKDLPEQARYDSWISNLRQLSQYVEGTGITLCIENLFSVPQCSSVEQIKGFIREAGEKNLGICLDTGHLHISNGRGDLQQTYREFILGAGPLLQALHLTDNCGSKDLHQMPYSARYGVDWKEVMQALTDVGYKDLFNFEILGECKAPLPIKRAKLEYIRTMSQYMLSPAFL